MHLQLQGTSDKPMLCEIWHVIYIDHLHCALCVHIQIYVYMPNYLVYHLPTTITSIAGILYAQYNLCLPFYIQFYPHGTQFYLVELRCTTASLLASQLHKYI